MKEIITDLDELSAISDEIDVQKDNKLVKVISTELKNTIKEKNLPALSAPQIGYNIRMFSINFDGEIRCFINPMYKPAGPGIIQKESCASIPGKKYLRLRYQIIDVAYQNTIGETKTSVFRGLAAIVFQEQVDHLNGLLLSDVGLEIGDDFEKASEEEQNEVIEAYFNMLNNKKETLNQEIEEDSNLKEISDAINFMDSVRAGETKLSSQTFEVVREHKEEELLN